MSEATCAADTTADTRHTLDEVSVGEVFALFEECDTALVDTVASARFKFEIDILLVERLLQRVAESSASCEDSAEVRSVVEYAFFKRSDFHILAVEECLQFLEREGGVDVRFDFLVENLCFLAVQGPINTTFAPGVVSLIYLEIIAIGERLCEICSTIFGKFFLI